MGESRRWSPWKWLRDEHPDFRVHEAELPAGLMGCLDHHRRTVWLDSRLTDVERLSTIAHECGHIELDVASGLHVVQAPEWKVDRWAARRLMPVRCLQRAFTWSSSLPEIADELGVDQRMLRARLRCLTDEEQDVIMDAIARMRVA
jgi:hypothetical protein